MKKNEKKDEIKAGDSQSSIVNRLREKLSKNGLFEYDDGDPKALTHEIFNLYQGVQNKGSSGKPKLEKQGWEALNNIYQNLDDPAFVAKLKTPEGMNQTLEDLKQLSTPLLEGNTKNRKAGTGGASAFQALNDKDKKPENPNQTNDDKNKNAKEDNPGNSQGFTFDDILKYIEIAKKIREQINASIGALFKNKENPKPTMGGPKSNNSSAPSASGGNTAPSSSPPSNEPTPNTPPPLPDTQPSPAKALMDKTDGFTALSPANTRTGNLSPEVAAAEAVKKTEEEERRHNMP